MIRLELELVDPPLLLLSPKRMLFEGELRMEMRRRIIMLFMDNIL